MFLEETARHCEVKIRVRFPPLDQKIPSGLSEPPEEAGTANAVNPNIRRAEDRYVEIENDVRARLICEHVPDGLSMSF